MINLNELNKYFNSLRNFISLDNVTYLQFKIKNWTPAIPINDIILDELVTSHILKYNIIMDDTTIQDKVQLLKLIDNASLEQIEHLKIGITLSFEKDKLINFFTQNTENTFIFFLLKNFVKYVDSIDNLNNNNYLNIYIIDSNISNISNDYLRISTFDELNSNEIIDLSKDTKEKFLCINRIFGERKNITKISHIPDFWSLETQDLMYQDLKHISLLYTLHLIANKSNLDNREFQIKGHYNLSLKLDTPSPEINQLKLKEILDFTIDEDSNRHTERVLIVRNVLTTYLSSSSTACEFNEKINQIVATIWHHFELYVQNEIKVFMDQKNKLLQESVTVADKITQQNIKNNEYFQKNIIIIIGLVISNFIPLFKNIDNPFYYNLLTIFVVILISYLNSKTIKDAKKQLNNSINKFEFYVENISNKSLNGLSIDDLKTKFIDPDKDILNSNLKIYKVISFLIIVLSILILIWLIDYHHPELFKSIYTFCKSLFIQMKEDFIDLFNPTTK